MLGGGAVCGGNDPHPPCCFFYNERKFSFLLNVPAVERVWMPPACPFILLIRFHIRVRSWDPSPPLSDGLIH